MKLDIVYFTFKCGKIIKLNFSEEGKANTKKSTDGSKSESGCGSGFIIKDSFFKQSYKLSDDCSIFQCEIFGIKKACETIKLMVTVNKSLAICVDSQAALKSLRAMTKLTSLPSREHPVTHHGSRKLRFLYV